MGFLRDFNPQFVSNMNWDREKSNPSEWGDPEMEQHQISQGGWWWFRTQEQLSGEVLIRQIYDYTSEKASYLTEHGGLD